MSANHSTYVKVPTDIDLYSPLETITVRVTGVDKQRFHALAETLGMSEARLGLTAIRRLLEEQAMPSPPMPSEVDLASERITIRLRPGDRHRIRERAVARRMKDAGYLAALVRAHVVADPPLPAAELQELKRAVAAMVRAIAALSSSASLLARHPQHIDTVWNELRHTRVRVIALERRFHAYTKAAVIAWEAPSA